VTEFVPSGATPAAARTKPRRVKLPLFPTGETLC
jgi:hypothetical protein